MLRPCLLAALVLAAWSLPADLPHPSDLALVLGPEEFEDYLDQWLEVEQERRAANGTVFHDADVRSGCSLHVNQDFGQPQPVYIRNGRYIAASGNNGRVRLNSRETVLVACVGSGRSILHPRLSKTGLASATARCEGGTSISGSGWLSGRGEFGGLTCSGHSSHDALATNDRCYGNNLVIRVGYNVNSKFHPLYYSCFDQARLEVLYVWYEQGPEHAVSQVGVSRPNWMAGSFYPGVDINNYYRQATQKKEIAKLIGEDLTNKYITNIHFLNRGHLTAKSDFALATGQRTTFYFINAAPQWQAFNSGNWNTLEQELRFRIGAAGYNTMVYTGTYGISYLRDSNNRPVDLYLYRDKNNNNKLPVPLYYYKVVVDESRQIGTAFIGINNPYVTDSEARSLAFCKDRCRNNSAFGWLKWRPDRVDLGYSFCCTLADFRKVVKHLPKFKVNGLLA